MFRVEDFIEAIDKTDGAPLIAGKSLLVAIVFLVQ